MQYDGEHTTLSVRPEEMIILQQPLFTRQPASDRVPMQCRGICVYTADVVNVNGTVIVNCLRAVFIEVVINVHCAYCMKSPKPTELIDFSVLSGRACEYTIRFPPLNTTPRIV